MRSQIVLIFAAAVFAGVLSGCGGPASNSTVDNVANVRVDTNNPINEITKPEVVTNNGPTLTPVFKAYCQAWVKNDEAALRKVYSSGTLKEFEQQMKEEKAKSLMKFLEVDKVSGTPCEVSNETITGDKAMATIKTNKYPRGLQVEFVKENGEWKLTNRSPALSSTGSTAANANAVK
ncbi:MAG: hypothetical protein ABIV21_07685 [Pyrinomonadaceae bacterium]